MVDKAFIHPRGQRRTLTGLSIASICRREGIARATDSTFTEDRPSHPGGGFSVVFEAFRVYGPATMDDVRELREIEGWSDHERALAYWRAADHFGDPEGTETLEWLAETPTATLAEAGRSDYRPNRTWITDDGRMLTPTVIDWQL